MYTTQNAQSAAPNSNFIKSMIRIANPEWSAEQVEAEAQKKMAELNNPSGDEGCEFCSS